MIQSAKATACGIGAKMNAMMIGGNGRITGPITGMSDSKKLKTKMTTA